MLWDSEFFFVPVLPGFQLALLQGLWDLQLLPLWVLPVKCCVSLQHSNNITEGLVILEVLAFMTTYCGGFYGSCLSCACVDALIYSETASSARGKEVSLKHCVRLSSSPLAEEAVAGIDHGVNICTALSSCQIQRPEKRQVSNLQL